MRSLLVGDRFYFRRLWHKPRAKAVCRCASCCCYQWPQGLLSSLSVQEPPPLLLAPMRKNPPGGRSTCTRLDFWNLLSAFNMLSVKVSKWLAKMILCNCSFLQMTTVTFYWTRSKIKPSIWPEEPRIFLRSINNMGELPTFVKGSKWFEILFQSTLVPYRCPP